MLGWLQCFMLPNDVVLDVGSGDGRYRHVGGKEYYALDSWLPAKPDYLMDLNKSGLPTDRKFSVIMLLDVLEHMDKNNGKRILQNAID